MHVEVDTRTGRVEQPVVRVRSRRGRRRTRGPAMAAGVVLATLLAVACSGDPAGELRATGTEPSAAVCEQPPVTGTGDAFSYPATLDELVADADVVVDARIIGESGPVTDGGQRQPMAISVDETFRGAVGGDPTLVRLQTSYTVTGQDGTHLGSWDLEPWYCPGERYVLFLDRLPEGGYVALPRQGAIRTDPPAGGRAPTDLVASLRELDPDALRAEVRAAAARTGS